MAPKEIYVKKGSQTEGLCTEKKCVCSSVHFYLAQICEICSPENVYCKHYVKRAGKPAHEEKTEFLCALACIQIRSLKGLVLPLSLSLSLTPPPTRVQGLGPSLHQRQHVASPSWTLISLAPTCVPDASDIAARCALGSQEKQRQPVGSKVGWDWAAGTRPPDFGRGQAPPYHYQA